ncbi:rhodanese-like domain-containing protein [Bacteroidota bacterium]
MKGKRILIAVVIFVLILIVGILTIHKPDVKYTITTAQALENALSLADEIFPEDIVYIVEDTMPGYQLIDIRTPFDYIKGHISSSVNIPYNIMLEEDNLEFIRALDKDSVIIILYGNDQSQANCPWMLLKQIGIENVKVMLGGYDYFTTGALDLYDMPDIPEYLVEEPKYDYPELIQNNSAINVDAQEAEIILPKRKKKESAAEGGC